MRVYGYVRMSSADQNEDRQLIAMNEIGVSSAMIFIDKIRMSLTTHRKQDHKKHIDFLRREARSL
jgi:DNA invertase Pin-like site-specific DNA recombinase